MRTGILAAVLAAVLILSGCADGQQKAPIEYAESGFEASVSGVIGGVAFEALVTAAPPDPAGGERDVSIQFFAPVTLAGVPMTRRQGIVRCECGGVGFDAAGRAWLDVADLLCARGDVPAISKMPDSAIVVVSLASGDRISTITIDTATRLPLRATLTSPRTVEVEVTGFSRGTAPNPTGGELF